MQLIKNYFNFPYWFSLFHTILQQMRDENSAFTDTLKLPFYYGSLKI